jgi:hypothetical protein
VTVRWLTVFVDLAGEKSDETERFWLAVTGTSPSARRGPDGAFVTLVPPHGDAYLRAQRIRSGDGGCHLDLHVDDVDEAAARATELGARERFREDGLVVFDSPGGFPFCLVRWDGEATVPPAVRLDGTGLSRIDQLCLDVPPGLYEAECGFWAALTGWEVHDGGLPEFRFAGPVGTPVRLLFQRLENALNDDGARVSGHIDFSAEDRADVADRHVAAGARIVATFPHWITLADPAGRLYCLTVPGSAGLSSTSH